MPQGVKPNKLSRLLPKFRNRLEARGFNSVRAFAQVVLDNDSTIESSLDVFTTRLYKLMSGCTKPDIVTAAWLANIVEISLDDVAAAFKELKEQKQEQNHSASGRLQSCSETDTTGLLSTTGMYNFGFTYGKAS